MVEFDKSNFRRDEKVVKLLKVFSIILIFITIFSIITISNKNCAAEGGSAYAVFYAGGKQLLSGENVDARLPMASTTKIMTALTVIEHCGLNETVVVPKEAVGVEGSSVYLREGERFTVEQLLHALMLRSGNDSAVALALHVGKNMDDFVMMMNEYAARLGLENTRFANPHGLHDPDHYTSARDLGIIACRAMNDPVFKRIASCKRYDVPASEYTTARTWYNKNKLLSLYEGANGVKTGYTTKSGRCLVSAAERGGMQLVCVVLNRYDMWNESMSHLDAAFGEYCAVRGCKEGEALFSTSDGVAAGVCGGLDFAAKKADISSLRYRITPDRGHKLPIKAGADLGRIEVFAGERLLFSSPLYTINDIVTEKQLYAAENYRGEVEAKYGSEAEQISCKLRSGVPQGSR